MTDEAEVPPLTEEEIERMETLGWRTDFAGGLNDETILEMRKAMAEHADCTGPERCHGSLKWCSRCGDVSAACDADKCDTHPYRNVEPAALLAEYRTAIEKRVMVERLREAVFEVAGSQLSTNFEDHGEAARETETRAWEALEHRLRLKRNGR